MVFMTGTTCPLVTEYFRSLGATEFHFGLLNGLPLFALSFQLMGAFIANSAKRRKPIFMIIVILGRLIFIPVAFCAQILPPAYRDMVIALVVVMVTLSGLLSNIATPIWFSWMADLIPGRILNRYWGVRQRWMMLTWTGSFLVVTCFTYLVQWNIESAFKLVAVLAVLFGVLDIILFIWVKEPPNTIHTGVSWQATIMEPFRHPEYKSFVIIWCAWSACAFMAATFMQLYVLKVLAMPLWQVTLTWCILGIGNALSASAWGRVCDKHGHKPVLIMCLIFKPFITIVFMLINPETAPFVLPLAFIPDSILNAGLMVASNGYMLKIAPRQNRSMFIAYIVGLSGIAAGIASLGAGQFLHLCEGFSFERFGMTWTNYRMLFGASAVLRVICSIAAFKIREEKSSSPTSMITDVMGGPNLRFLRFPVGLNK